MSRPGFEPRTSCTAGRHSSKELYCFLIAIRNLYTAYYCCLFVTSTWLPQSLALASVHPWIIIHFQFCVFVSLPGSPLCRDSTQAIAIIYRSTQDRHVPAGLSPRPPAPHHSSKELVEQLYKPFGTSTQPIIAVSLATSTVGTSDFGTAISGRVFLVYLII
jgi:hypothetical protein